MTMTMSNQALSPDVADRLVVIMYVPETRQVRVVSREEGILNGVTIDPERAIWYYQRNSPSEQSFRIGSGVRVPEGDALYGPMMVIDPDNPAHVLSAENAVGDLSVGQLAR